MKPSSQARSLQLIWLCSSANATLYGMTQRRKYAPGYWLADPSSCIEVKVAFRMSLSHALLRLSHQVPPNCRVYRQTPKVCRDRPQFTQSFEGLTFLYIPASAIQSPHGVPYSKLFGTECMQVRSCCCIRLLTAQLIHISQGVNCTLWKFATKSWFTPSPFLHLPRFNPKCAPLFYVGAR